MPAPRIPDPDRFDQDVAATLALYAEVKKDTLFASFVFVMGRNTCGLNAEQVQCTRGTCTTSSTSKMPASVVPDPDRFDQAVAATLALHAEVKKEILFASFTFVMGSTAASPRSKCTRGTTCT